jgi:hypothetical protein
MGTIGDGSGQADQPGFDPDWPWRPPVQVPVERSPERAGLLAVLFGVAAALFAWVTILYAWRGDSWLIWLPNGCATVLLLVSAGRWATRWRRQRERQAH